MDWIQHIAADTGVLLLHILVWVLCFAGVLLACLSLPGPWLASAACLVAIFLSGDGRPGYWDLAAFLVIAVATEVIEAFAGSWGVTRRGGSGWTGFAALIGGIVGMIVGVPVPIVGSLLGMLVGSFLFAFLVEQYRMKTTQHAAHVAMGAVVARLAVVFVKVAATLGMSFYLLLALYL